MATTVALAFVMHAPPALANDEDDVRAAILAADHVFDARDAKLAAGIYAPDVIWQNPLGASLQRTIA